jgi:hypothetical protein
MFFFSLYPSVEEDMIVDWSIQRRWKRKNQGMTSTMRLLTVIGCDRWIGKTKWVCLKIVYP